MATEYTLPFTAAEIVERLNALDNLNTMVQQAVETYLAQKLTVYRGEIA